MNPDKSEVYCSLSVDDNSRRMITQYTCMHIGALPVRYLGVPFLSGKLSTKDCDLLICKITSRITNWRAKTLSYTGRAQLVHSVLQSISNYWMAIFLLPSSIIKTIERLCSDFL
ncbi:Putative ribonuclease H protein At1g65750 [Linum perenne]